MKKILLYFIIIILIGVACKSSTDIAAISNHPRDYVGKVVTVKGNVSEVFSLAIVNYFKISDETGSIIVYTEKPLPVKGEHLIITGEVKYYTFGTQRLLAIKESAD